MSLNELLEIGRDLAHLQIATATQLLCDVGRNILRPSLSGIESLGHN
jgi:hypothetical protein